MFLTSEITRFYYVIKPYIYYKSPVTLFICIQPSRTVPTALLPASDQWPLLIRVAKAIVDLLSPLWLHGEEVYILCRYYRLELFSPLKYDMMLATLLLVDGHLLETLRHILFLGDTTGIVWDTLACDIAEQLIYLSANRLRKLGRSSVSPRIWVSPYIYLAWVSISDLARVILAEWPLLLMIGLLEADRDQLSVSGFELGQLYLINESFVYLLHNCIVLLIEILHLQFSQHSLVILWQLFNLLRQQFQILF